MDDQEPLLKELREIRENLITIKWTVYGAVLFLAFLTVRLTHC